MVQFLRVPRAKSSKYGADEQASMISYCSSGLRECSRFRVAMKFTCRRPGARVRAFLPSLAYDNFHGIDSLVSTHGDHALILHTKGTGDFVRSITSGMPGRPPTW